MPVEPDEHLAVARRFVAAMRKGDEAAFLAMGEPDATVWHNYDGMEGDLAATAKTLTQLHQGVPDIAWTDGVLTATTAGFVWQSALTGTGPGGVFHANTCVVVTLSDRGMITRIDEYLDPAQLATLSG